MFVLASVISVQEIISVLILIHFDNYNFISNSDLSSRNNDYFNSNSFFTIISVLILISI